MQLYQANTFWQRFKGLLGKKTWPANQVLLIRPCSSVHTVGMRFPICVIFLGRDYRVLKVISFLKPWRLAYCRKAYCVLELATGVLSEDKALAWEQACCLAEGFFQQISEKRTGN
ncbi:hypothetical protein GCM10011450_17280 [Advenella faeciporci]|uniref:DUF192 domain-containing protein n=1 Tax=Advenella faeciporci TaxID=797535 RepID=A0A918JLF8_9BURK|nr:DUF192 domain-containing protein [Advenella faeciporci]GGW87878.1 hypothetical protein GCM10011450_17280 [Advenella faeciporci]